MNGEVSTSTAHTDVFKDIVLSLDPATLDLALGHKPVKTIEADGALVLAEEDSIRNELNQQLERIWNEFPNGMLDISEDKLGRLPPDGDAVKVEDQTEEKVKQRDPNKMMEWEEMEKLRSEVFIQLNDARNELWFALELSKTLSASSSFHSQHPPAPIAAQPSHKGKGKGNHTPATISAVPSAPTEPPILPPGTYSATPSAAPLDTLYNQVHELNQAVQAKDRALQDCEGLIDSAVGELHLMTAAGDRFWHDIRSLKVGARGRDQWAVIPKPDFGGTFASGEKAKDVIIPYAIDEAPKSTRARCLAGFDLDPTKADALTFGARHYLRLRATLRDDSGAVLGSTPVTADAGSSVRGQMEAAQMEAFDEDIFHAVRFEALRVAGHEAEQQSVSIPVANHTLSFELYDSRSPPVTPTSPLCDTIISAARLGLLNVHRRRKANLIAQFTSLVLPVPTILLPILDMLRYRHMCGVILSIIKNLVETLRQAGLDAEVEMKMLGDDAQDAEALRGILAGNTGVDGVKGKFKMTVQGCPGIAIEAAAPHLTTVILPDRKFGLANPEELLHIASREIASQLRRLVNTLLVGKFPSSRREEIYYDELEESVVIDRLGSMKLTIPPPFHSVFVNVDSDRVAAFDSRHEDDLLEWLDTVVAAVVGSEDTDGVAGGEVSGPVGI
ncbi:hypothetical protein IAT38_000717 [Cryptococcus sp. DSM 104549]